MHLKALILFYNSCFAYVSQIEIMHHYDFLFDAHLQAQYCKKSSTYFWVILVVSICVLAFYDMDENSSRQSEA